MDVAFERRVIAWYEKACEWPPAGRAASLAAALADQPETLAAVDAMLRADAIAGLLPTLPPEPADPSARRDEAPPPERIGPYRIAGELGRGGMGVVYRAERDDGVFEQHVAIKLIRHGLFSSAALAQFASERRLLARLHHPHIAQLLDGGVGADGASYIIMELIDGTPITGYADRHGLDLAARLDLFLQACDATEYAHRNLVVHADIKPNNVVVADIFGVKLLDFGIARLVGQGAGEGISPHTPGYASPASVRGLALTPADDVFALGVLLRALIASAAGVDADLAAIAAKAAADSVDIRYGAVSELVDDIGRWQQHKSVSARPAGRGRLALLLWRRRRGPLTAAALGIALLIATTIVTTILYIRADAARTAAERRFEETRSLSLYLVDDVTKALAPLPGSGPIRQRIALRANAALGQLRVVPGASPELQVDSARADTRVGEILVNSDLSQKSGPKAGNAALMHAEATLRRLVAADPGRPDLVVALARTLVGRVRYLEIDDSQPKPAMALAREIVRRIDALPEPVRSSPDAIDARWDAELMMGNILETQSDYAAQLSLVRAIAARYPRLPLPRDAERALRLETTFTLLGDGEYYTGNLRGSLGSYRLALAALTPPAFARDARIAVREGYAAFNLASTLFELHQRAEALETIRLGNDAMDRLASFDTGPLALHMQAIVKLEYATELGIAGRHDQAIALGRQSVAERVAQAGLQPNSYEALRSVPVGMRPLYEIYRRAGREAEACAGFAATDAAWNAVARRMPLTTFDSGTERIFLDKLIASCRKPKKKVSPG